jgi:hypothetical protein
VIGNYIGIGKDQNALGNVIGIWVDDVPKTLILFNYIAGNSEAGVYIMGSNASANLVEKNWIGLGPSGQTYNHGNGRDPKNPFPIGVYIQDSSSNTIGGTAPGEGNIISGNNVGVYIFGSGGSSTNNQILGNSIGLSVKGRSKPPGNVLYGVMLFNAPYNNAPKSGPSRNQFARNGIADFREFTGAVATTTQSSSSRGSGSKTRKPAHHPRHVVHQSLRRTSIHASVAIRGRHVPAGPMQKRD